MADYSWIGPLVGAVGKGVNSYATSAQASQISQAAFQQMLDELGKRFAEYDAMGKAGYSDIAPQLQGASALSSIPQDAVGRGAEQQSIAALQQLADSGGLNLSDMKALNDIQRNLNQQSSARQKGLANEYAARGQLGSGAQLAMDLSNNQGAAESANQRGESIAAQAQDRALQAILQKGQVGRQMASDDYMRRSEAAKAQDAIEARNAAARTDASKYNNSLRGQAFEDELAKEKGKSGLTESLNKTLSDKGQDLSKTTRLQGQYRNDLIDQGASAYSSYGSKNKNSDGSDSSSGDSGSDQPDDEWNY